LSCNSAINAALVAGSGAVDAIAAGLQQLLKRPASRAE
jgi:hypothetical protein